MLAENTPWLEIALELPFELHRKNFLGPLSFWFAFFWIFFFIQDFLFSFLPSFSFYRKLSRADRLDFRNRVNSSLHAVIASIGFILTLQTVLFSPNVSPSTILNHPSSLMEQFLCFSLGYIVYDTTCMLMYWNLFTPSALYHHIVSCLAFFSLGFGTGMFWTEVVIGTEISTPFVNNAFFLKWMGKGLCFFVSCFLVNLNRKQKKKNKRKRIVVCAQRCFVDSVVPFDPHCVPQRGVPLDCSFHTERRNVALVVSFEFK